MGVIAVQPRRGKSFGARIPAMRSALRGCLAREGAGLSVLEWESLRDTPMGLKAAVAVAATKRDMQAISDCLELLDFLETGGS